VTNIHYKQARNAYYNWNANGESTTLTFMGGNPSKEVYEITQRCASKFGLTLEKPQSVIDREAELARQAQQAQAERLAEEARERESARQAREAEQREMQWQANLDRQAQPAAQPAAQSVVTNPGLFKSSWDE
jgi:hypothetical protein